MRLGLCFIKSNLIVIFYAESRSLTFIFLDCLSLFLKNICKIRNFDKIFPRCLPLIKFYDSIGSPLKGYLALLFISLRKILLVCNFGSIMVYIYIYVFIKRHHRLLISRTKVKVYIEHVLGN